MGPASERFYSEALEGEERQALLDEVNYQGVRRGLSERDTATLLTEEWEEFALENFPDDAVVFLVVMGALALECSMLLS